MGALEQALSNRRDRDAPRQYLQASSESPQLAAAVSSHTYQEKARSGPQDIYLDAAKADQSPKPTFDEDGPRIQPALIYVSWQSVRCILRGQQSLNNILAMPRQSSIQAQQSEQYGGQSIVPLLLQA
ncbi:MAG: hypothetical protein M1836_008113 [Candelina mexicana]|nr:MAG: hypothetical protein M1836_008113 [Candelina mexicana]